MNNITALWSLLLVFMISADAIETDKGNCNETLDFEEPSKLLSRRKRFLVFPDGSSFQLVFEHQNHGYLQIGNIVWFSNTAALAWELPSDPKLFYFLKKGTEFHGNRRMDSKHIYYLDEDGKVLGKVPYHRKFIVNPAFAKRSISGSTPEGNDLFKRISIKDMHAKEKGRNHFQDLEQDRIDFHRHTRKDLYGKVETFLEGMGWNGSECVLRMLCETSKPNDKQGTFLEEIFKATFTLVTFAWNV